MLIKDQLRVRMDQLQMPVTELARRVGVSGQSVRHWLEGRNYPTKVKTALIEDALSVRLDFSEGTTEQGVTVDETLRKADIETFILISRLPPDVQDLFAELAEKFLSRPQVSERSGWVPADMLPPDLETAPPPMRAPVRPPVQSPAQAPIQSARAIPPGPANHGRRESRRLVGK